MNKRASKTNRNQVHTAKSPKGMGDYYGTGIRAKIGRMRSGMGMEVVSKKQLKNPPKSIA